MKAGIRQRGIYIMQQRNKSNKKFMVLSAIGIFMVVDHHTFTALNLFGDYIPYNSFFMPMFVFISGYFNKVDTSTRFLPYIGKKIRTLLLPFAGLSVFVFIMQQLMTAFKGGEMTAYGAWYISYVLQRIITVGPFAAIAEPTWFVITLFSVLLIYAVLKKFLYKIWNSYVMLVIFCALHLFAVYFAKTALPYSSEYLLLPLKVIFFLPFIEMGIIYRDHLEEKHSALPGGGKIALLFILLFINMIRTLYLPIPYDLAFDSIDELSGFTSPYIVTPLLSSAVGILFWLTLVDLIGKLVYESRFVNFMSCNTFWIMGLHITFFNILNCILLVINDHIAALPYFDAEYFRESEWYYWELSADFKLAYVIIGILGPLALKWIFDRLCALVARSLLKKPAA